MKKNRKRYVYDKQPSQRETLPEMILRHGLTAHIMRTSEEYCLLIQAKTLIEACGIA